MGGDRHQKTIKSHNMNKLIRNAFIKNHGGVPKLSGSFSQEDSIGLATTTKKKPRGSVGRGGRISLVWGLGVTPWPGDTDPRWP